MTVEVVRIQEEDNDAEKAGLTLRGEDNNNQKEDRNKAGKIKIGSKISIFQGRE